jgi:hypothetical protein
LMEQLNYNLSFRWFVGLSADDGRLTSASPLLGLRSVRGLMQYTLLDPAAPPAITRDCIRV